MSSYFYANIEGKKVDKLRVQNKKGPFPGEISLLKNVVPGIQKSGLDTYFCRNNVRCNKCS